MKTFPLKNTLHTLRRFAFFLAALLLAVSLSGLRAETWNQTAGGTYSWNDSANWSPASFPSSASAVANLTANIAASQTINLNQAITVGSLLVGDSSGNTAYTIAANGESLTFDNGASAATLTKNASTAIDDFTAPITIGSNGLIVDVQISGGFVRFATVSGGNLTKTGVGTLILNGSGAGLTGSVTVSQGVLQNSNNAGLDSDNAVTVSSGATFRSRAQTKVKSISGSGTVDMNLNGASVAVGSGAANTANKIVVNNAAAFLAPGDAGDSTGTLTLQQSAATTGIGVDLTAGSLVMDLSGTAAGNFDQIAILSTSDVSTLTINSAFNLTLQLGFAPTLGNSFKIVDIDGVTAVNGQFAQATSISAVFASNTYNFSINYAGGDGNDIVLTTVVPEPSGFALIGLGAFALLTGRRRRDSWPLTEENRPVRVP